jgi:uncharacterized protein
VAVYFLDSSALLKRYVSEMGTAWTQSLFDPGFRNRINIAAISAVEVIAAIARRFRAGSISLAEATRFSADLRRDLRRDFQVISITPVLISEAMRIAELHGLRGYDAIQLAAALAVRSASSLPITIVSADLELNAAASVEGFLVEDPNTHP